ncbi:DUF6714 family protein [Bacteroides uniformis]|uniref:Uncharacterized protein n=1 Tax=Bacteroides uniformis TaxID=820 RepID=A0A374MQQ8_BACUN|nr:DUF6714 family protein [Bacteroides uniformis]RGI73718.1 hypothetical protein DXD90_15070 [Bacteroides uniformis]
MMDKKLLIEEIKAAFTKVEYPKQITYDISGNHLECLEVENMFRNKEWRSLPDNFMFEERSALFFFSPEGFHYYLPAFMIFSLHDFVGADNIPDAIVRMLTLPTEVDTIILANAIKEYRLDKTISNLDFSEILQNNLNHINESINAFIKRAVLFDSQQGRAVFHYLEYIKKEFAYNWLNNEPQNAIQRYWFQFKL